MKAFRALLVIGAACGWSVLPVAADDIVRPSSTSNTAAISVDKLIADLDSNDFKTRDQATRALVERGAEAIQPVAKAAQGASLEVTSRAIEVLHQLMQGEDRETAAAAKASLEKLAASEHRNAARRATAILNPPQPQPVQPQGFPLNPQIQIQGIQIGGGARIQVQNNNGNKVIDAEADGRKVHIEESADGKIKMKVTENVEGKEKTSEYEAKNADELKKNHPDAHKLYEKYGQGGGFGARLQINGGNIQIQALPAQILPNQAVPRVIPRARAMIVPQQALEQMEAAQKQLDESIEQAKKLAESNSELKPLIEQLEKAQADLKQARGQLNP